MEDDSGVSLNMVDKLHSARTSVRILSSLLAASIALGVACYFLGIRICVYRIRRGLASPSGQVVKTRVSDADATLRTLRESLQTDNGRPVSIVTTYRGTNRILMASFLSNMASRVYFCDNVPRFEERDEDGDGFFELLIMHSKLNAFVFEEFVRDTDGNPEPIPAEQYISKYQSLVHSNASR